jgi:hypothetical protein
MSLLLVLSGGALVALYGGTLPHRPVLLNGGVLLHHPEILLGALRLHLAVLTAH